jgi:hypothetical protein
MICVSVRVRTSLFAANMSRANDQRLASDCGKGGRGEREEEKEKEERGKGGSGGGKTPYVCEY